jgi:hypothetical protein
MKGCMNPQGPSRSGGPKMAISGHFVQEVQKLVSADQEMIVCEIVETIVFSKKNNLLYIISKYLHAKALRNIAAAISHFRTKEK